MPVLFQRRTVYTRLREFNPCNLPAGPKGGQFGPKGACGPTGAGGGGFSTAVRDAGTAYGVGTAIDTSQAPKNPENLDRPQVMALIPDIGQPLPEWLEKELQEAAKENMRWRKRHDGKDSQGFHSTNGEYTPAREALHKEIMDKLFKNATPATGQPMIIYMGGLPGAGKTHTVLSKMNTKGFVIINADDLKEELPEYNGNNAEFLHEESSDLKNMALRIAREKGYDVIFDGTMASEKSVSKSINEFKNAGYRIETRFVDVPLSHSYKSALTRFYMGQVDFRQRAKGKRDRGKGKGSRVRGRLVPPNVITDSYDETWGSKPRATIEAMRGAFAAGSIVSGVTGEVIDTPERPGKWGTLRERRVSPWRLNIRPMRLVTSSG